MEVDEWIQLPIEEALVEEKLMEELGFLGEGAEWEMEEGENPFVTHTWEISQGG